jgi:hypothetical protein
MTAHLAISEGWTESSPGMGRLIQRAEPLTTRLMPGM